jgi:hypothetical protein
MPTGPATPAVTVPKFKFDALVEHAKRQDGELAELRQKLNTIRLYDERETWFWEAQGENHIESLACPVVIEADDLRALLASAVQPEGWQLMPKTATPEMLLQLGGDPDGPPIHVSLAKRTYRQLLAVAPAAPTGLSEASDGEVEAVPADKVSTLELAGLKAQQLAVFLSKAGHAEQAALVDELCDLLYALKHDQADQAPPSDTNRAKPSTWDIEGWNGCLRMAAGAIRHLLKNPPAQGGEQTYNYEHCLMIAGDLETEIKKRTQAHTVEESV